MTAVGLLGTGRMGGAMARALAAGGFEPILWNRSPEPARRLATELGGRVADRPADVAAAADVCITMLADGAAVDAVYGLPDGLVAGARPGNVLVDSSTVAPGTLGAHASAIRAAGAGVLDAPVSGSVPLAEAGRLTIMVGGDDADVARARPVLDALATTVFHLGPLGTGAAMKLAVNAVIFGLNEALAEGLVLAEAAGIPRQAAYDVLVQSAAGAPYVGYKRPSFVDPDGTPVMFALDLAAKDLGLIGELAAAAGLELPQVASNLAAIRAAAGADHGGRDLATVAGYLRDRRTAKEGHPA